LRAGTGSKPVLQRASCEHGRKGNKFFLRRVGCGKGQVANRFFGVLVVDMTVNKSVFYNGWPFRLPLGTCRKSDFWRAGSQGKVTYRFYSGLAADKGQFARVATRFYGGLATERGRRQNAAMALAMAGFPCLCC
jgi:hypothetical protein